MDPAGQGRLVNLHVADSIHQQIRQVIGRVASVSRHAAYTHIDERLVSGEELGTALAGDPHHFRHLNQHAAGKLEGLKII